VLARQRLVRVGAEIRLDLLERAVLRLGDTAAKKVTAQTPKKAYSQNVPCLVITSLSVRKVYETATLKPQLNIVHNAMAGPPIWSGKISEIISQNTGPSPTAKPMMYVRREASASQPTVAGTPAGTRPRGGRDWIDLSERARYPAAQSRKRGGAGRPRRRVWGDGGSGTTFIS
jgi:hypothetical protein